MHEIIKEYVLGDMKAVYHRETETGKTGLYLLPAGRECVPWESKKQSVDSLVQLKCCGDTYMGAYAGGVTMREGETVQMLSYSGQQVNEEDAVTEIVTELKSRKGYLVRHYLRWYKGEKSVEIQTELVNETADAVTLEMIASFSLGGLTPFTQGDAYDSLVLHRIRSVWSMEGRVESASIEDLQLEPSWGGHAVRCERFYQAGSMPVNRFFPFAAVEDKANGVIWGAQIAHNASWQMEVYRRDDGLALSGGLADRETGHWMKKVGAGERFLTPKAIVSVCEGTLNALCQRLTGAGMKYFEQAPESERELPIIFNEYCTTWGCPSHENIVEILQAIRGKGFSYFVIDCGWFKQDGIPWDVAMGDYEISQGLFPEGLHKTVEAIKAEGLRPGIWFEIDNVGCRAEAYNLTEHLLKKDGMPLTTTMRRFWDMRDPWVTQILTDRVIGTLRQYGFEYIKMDYNDSIGIGCDGAESPGEGLRQNMEASAAFVDKIGREVPGIVIENCASGGHKLEPLMMSKCSMASFSDAHECEEIPIIAANLHRTILPCQSQIWCVIREDDSLKRIAYSIAATFLGRMCISGDVTGLFDEQWRLIEAGMAFYRQIAPIIKDGYTTFYGEIGASYRHLAGWQAILREGAQGQAYLALHTFHGGHEQIRVELPERYCVTGWYSDSEPAFEVEGKTLFFHIKEDSRAVALRLEKQE